MATTAEIVSTHQDPGEGQIAKFLGTWTERLEAGRVRGATAPERIELRQFVAGTTGQMVDTWDASEVLTDDGARRVWARALEDASAQTGPVHRYVVQVLAKGGKNQGRVVVTIETDSAVMGDVPSAAALSTAHSAFALRTLESTARIVESMNATLRDENLELRKRIVQLEQERASAWDRQEALLKATWEIESAREEAKASATVKVKAAEQLEKIVPLIRDVVVAKIQDAEIRKHMKAAPMEVGLLIAEAMPDKKAKREFLRWVAGVKGLDPNALEQASEAEAEKEAAAKSETKDAGQTSGESGALPMFGGSITVGPVTVGTGGVDVHPSVGLGANVGGVGGGASVGLDGAQAGLGLGTAGGAWGRIGLDGAAVGGNVAGLEARGGGNWGDRSSWGVHVAAALPAVLASLPSVTTGPKRLAGALVAAAGEGWAPAKVAIGAVLEAARQGDPLAADLANKLAAQLAAQEATAAALRARGVPAARAAARARALARLTIAM